MGVGSWPVGTGHPCIGCTEKGVGFTKPIHALAELLTVTPPTQFARPAEEQGQGSTLATVGTVAAVGGLAAGAGAQLAKNLGQAPGGAAREEGQRGGALTRWEEPC